MQVPTTARALAPISRRRCVSSAAELSCDRPDSTAPTSQIRNARHGAPLPEAAWTALIRGDAAGDALNTAPAIADSAQGGAPLPKPAPNTTPKQNAGVSWLHDAYLWWRPARSGAPDEP